MLKIFFTVLGYVIIIGLFIFACYVIYYSFVTL
jgi:flagellar biogenesis protein FliO